MNTQRYTRGSVWRKWDLHVHAPGTKLCDGYTPKDGRPDLEKFCKTIHNSDVAVLAITDYFSLDSYFAIKGKYDELYKDNKKLLLPNLELRLPVAVNRDGQEVNLHLIFSPALTRDDANKFLAYLKTSGTTGADRSSVRCGDLKSKQDFDSATVSIEAINVAIGETFGEHAKIPAIRQKYLLVVASAKGDGIRPGGSGIQRKNLLTDEIDKFSDAFFANAGSRDYFLGVDRLETNDLTAPKPVFDGSDAHSFDELQSRLGRQVATSGCQRNITWIKADPAYAGLLQTLIEPADRVAIQATEPDKKEPYKVISKVRFSDTDDFPAEVFFNRNLNAIIGSRSSGKSALLAFIAHAVDPDETVRLQVEAYGFRDSKEAGPAAGFSWADVSGVTCEVEWESGEGTEGKVIYIPQNSLYTLSEQPDEITKKIAPALFRTYPTVKVVYDRSMSKVVTTNIDIRSAIEDWFGLADRIEDREHEIKDLGDKAAITVERDRLQAEIDRIKVATSLTDDEVAEYQRVANLLDSKESRLKEITVELDQLSSYVTSPAEAANAAIRPQAVKVTVNVSPSTSELPESIAAHIEKIKDSAIKDIVAAVEKTLLDGVTALNAEGTKLAADIASIKQDHTSLIAKHEANKELSVVVAEHKKQVASLENITKRERSREKLIKDQRIAVTKIEQGITDRDADLSTLERAFNAEERVLTDLKFGIEAGVPPDDVEHVSVGFSQRNVNDYIKDKGSSVDYEAAQADPSKFLKALRGRKVTLNKKYEPKVVAADVLTLTKEIRFTAELDGDHIGGFSRSSMTPGKQALFALTLILNESQEPWPLLIDQPEDDLDSRSIYDTIVPYLVKRKKERQIIMISHDANLVIGADSEEVIVANRHGADRPNMDSRTFEYLTGSLEHSQGYSGASPTILSRCGIREHACEILDGGEEAFRKRREKYKI